MDWLSEFVIVVITAVAAVSIGFGVHRRDPWSAIALSTVGVVMYLLALRWTLSIAEEAFYAAAAMSLGAIMWTLGSERGRTARRMRSAAHDEASQARA